MSLNSSQRKIRPRERGQKVRRTAERLTSIRLFPLIGLALCVSLNAFPMIGRSHMQPTRPAADTQQPAPSKPTQTPGVNSTPSPSPTPYTRQRIVTAKPDAASAEPESDAAATSAETVDEDEVVRVTSNLVLVPASVVDARGRSVNDLKVEDFELRVDGQVKPISDLNRTETPVHIALLFDNSASLSAARAFEKQAATRFFQSVVRPIDRAAIYSISTLPRLEQGFTNNVPGLMRTIEHFGPPEGATALFDTITQAANYLRPVPGRKVIVLVSDGTDTVSDISFDEALTRALSADCQVYVVQTRQIEDPNLHDPVSEGRLAKLTEQTGGAVYAPRAAEELDNAFTQISLDLAQQYVLSYSPEEERKDKYFRFINLRVKTRPNLRVRARRGFYPSAAQNESASLFGSAMAGSGISGGAASQQQQSSRAYQPAPSSGAGLSVAYNERPESSARNAPVESAGDNKIAPRKIGPNGPQEDDEHTSTAVKATPAASIRPAEARPTWGGTLTSTAAPPPRDSSNTPAPTTPTPEATPKPTPTPAPKTPAQTPAPKTSPLTTEATKQRTTVSGGVLNTKATSLPKPAYPHAAKSIGVSGKVIVEVTIGEDGKVIEARVSSGHPLLQAAAVSAARLARFSPTLLSGEPVRVQGTIIYTFVWP